MMIATTPKRRIAPITEQTFRYWGKSTDKQTRPRRRRTAKNTARPQSRSVQRAAQYRVDTVATASRRPFFPSRLHLVVICTATLLIGAVSAVDTYWSFKNQEILLEYEQNPVGRWLILLDGGDVALFMTAKMIGTLVVMCAIPLLYRFRPSWGLTVGISVGTFQLLLFFYLNLGQYVATM